MTITERDDDRATLEYAEADPAAEATEHDVAGLEHDVEILTDTWGVPHIYATTKLDAYTAQGFQAARDRLFQIDLWRRRGLGQLAEVLGAAYIEQDRATRLFLYRGDMRAEWLAYGTDTRDIVDAFVAGINAYVTWANAAPEERLPPEFGVLGYRPSTWCAEDVVRIRTHGLLYNVEQELARALTLRDLGEAGERLRAVREPETEQGVTGTELYEHLDESVLDVYRLAFQPVDFGGATASELSTPSGSNNWVIAPERTTSGRPVLASDPHRAVGLPSLRYLTHLEAPGLSVIGAGEPFLPGISLGHNEHVAFSLTIWAVDQEDLYVYELHPDDDTRYRYNGGWERMRTVEETAAVKDEVDAVHTLSFTRHGPIVHVDVEHRLAVAVRAVWLEPGMAPYLGSLEFQGVKGAKEFARALRRWGAPGTNQIYATVDGDIGWQASAIVPKRPNWDGSLPVPGDGSFEWDGFATVEELPHDHNPAKGWFASANENNLPADYDSAALTTTTDWYSNARAERLAEWFESGDPLSIESSQRMHADALNVHGRRLLARLEGLAVPGHAAEWNELLAWDGVESADSRAALLFQVWQRRHLRPWLVDTSLARLGVESGAVASARHRLLGQDTLFSDLRLDLRMLDTLDTADSADRTLLEQGLDETLGAAIDEIRGMLGAEPGMWTWGALHQTRLRHPILHRAAQAGALGIPAEWGELPAVPRAGSGDTVGLTGYDAEFNAVIGATFRMAVDVGNWDASRVINAPGQSGDPRSTHYADLLPLWSRDEYFPMLYSREAVDAATSERVVLRPAQQ